MSHKYRDSGNKAGTCLLCGLLEKDHKKVYDSSEQADRLAYAIEELIDAKIADTQRDSLNPFSHTSDPRQQLLQILTEILGGLAPAP